MCSSPLQVRSFFTPPFIYALINITIFAFAYANWIEGYKYGQLNMQIPHFDAQPSISCSQGFLHLRALGSFLKNGP